MSLRLRSTPPSQLICALLYSALSACTVLPSADQRTDSSWQSYEEAHAAFARIQPGKTTAEDLRGMSFDPYKHPNIRLLNHLELTRIFLPNESIRLADLDPDIQTCLKARNACIGYEVNLGSSHRVRYGNALSDIFNFRRNTRITGWKFSGLIVLQEQTVIYKLSSGQPNTLEYENKKNPLGPLQDLSLPAPR